MEEEFVVPSFSPIHEHDVDLRSELDRLREAVKDAVSEARQSSSFCQRIQHDISEFVVSEEHVRSSSSFDNVEALAMSTTSILKRMTLFENYIIGKVREEVRSEWNNKKHLAGISFISDQHDNTSALPLEMNEMRSEFEKLQKQQREFEGRLEALVADSVYAQGVVRKEMKSYASKVRAHVLTLQEELHSATATLQSRIAETKAREDTMDVTVLHGLTGALTALHHGLHEERQTHETERRQCMTLLNRIIERVKALEERNEILSVELCQLLREGVNRDADTSLQSDISSSIALAEVRLSFDQQLGQLARDLCDVNGVAQDLQARYEEQQDVLDRNATDIAALRRAIVELAPYNATAAADNVPPPFELMEKHIMKKRGYGHGQPPIDATVQLLQCQTIHLQRSYAFQTWMTWSRGRAQLKKDTTILSLFTKQRDQILDLAGRLHSMTATPAALTQSPDTGEEEMVGRIHTRELLLAMSHVQRNWTSFLQIIQSLRPWVRYVDGQLEETRRREPTIQRTHTSKPVSRVQPTLSSSVAR